MQQWREAFANDDGSWFTSMWLFGDARNPSARAWLALGAHKTDDDPGNGNYGWRDLKRLAEICPIEGGARWQSK